MLELDRVDEKGSDDGRWLAKLVEELRTPVFSWGQWCQCDNGKERIHEER